MISHYEILQKVGAGGMGTVYKARDTKLGRIVALKIPADHVIADENRRNRFLQEARAAAALDHPNICTLYEIGEHDETMFISMAYLEGRQLSDRISEGPLPIREAVSIASEIARGLAQAHERGIVHRDIKSANIMLTDRGVRIMDFGLAKLTNETRLTIHGAIMGTVDYMSPEQARGRTVDFRTDIYSLGVLLYEMLAGRLPFAGANDQAVIYSLLNTEPPFISTVRDDCPPELERLVLKMLRKDPAERHQSMTEVIEELAAPADSVTIAPPRRTAPSIAVLAFADMSPEKDQDYFCEGIAEELINALTHIEDMRVIARTSAFSYKGRDVNVRDIGSQLNVGAILEGSVRKAGRRLRVTAQLVDACTGHHLWCERFDRTMDDVFTIQDEITEAIVDSLKIKLLGKERLRKREAVDVDVYNQYLQGRYFWNKRTGPDLRRAIDCFESALRRNDHYAPAHAGLALTYALMPVYSRLPAAQAIGKAYSHACRAIEIDQTLADAYAALTFLADWYQYDWRTAEQYSEQAISLNPGSALAYEWSAYGRLFRGLFDQAVEQMTRAFSLDPVSIAINRDLGMVYAYAGRFEKAIEAETRAIEMDPSQMYTYLHRAIAYLGMDMYEQALADCEKEAEIAAGAHVWAETFQAYVHIRQNRTDLARRILDSVLRQERLYGVSPFHLASLHLILGETDRGFELLEVAYQQRDHWLCWLKIAPFLKEIRSDPRYRDMLVRMNLTE